jgi:ABC-type multidrug transport system fused ATPase/permease subunit
MAWTNLTLLTATLLAFLPITVLTYLMRSKLRKWGKENSEAVKNIIKTLNHGLGGFKETRIIGCSDFFDEVMQSNTKKYVKTATLTGSFEMLPRILIESTLVIFIVSFIAISSIFLPQKSGFLVPSLSVFAVSSIRLLPAASQIMTTLGTIQSKRYVINLIYSDLVSTSYQAHQDSLQIKNQERKEVLIENPDIAGIKFEQEIELSGLTYCYIDSLKPAVNNVSLKIKKGESVAFIGKSGSGKTTLVDIVLGLLIPQFGDILVDNNSIYKNLRDWQNLVGYIPQSIFLLDDTIRNNIAFGVPSHLICPDRLQKAIVSAQLGDLIEQLPKGVDTRVGERGVMLSGGQRQRIGIARALYHEREVLILDEATSALDRETEEKVSSSIQALFGLKTIIIIAHRLSTIKHCDRVYMLDKGELKKSGTFSEVVA